MNLNQITVPAIDMEQSIAFYELLGLQPIVKSNPHYARFVCPDGQSTFSLHLVEKAPGDDGIWVYFETAHLDEEVARLMEKGIVFDEMPIRLVAVGDCPARN